MTDPARRWRRDVATLRRAAEGGFFDGLEGLRDRDFQARKKVQELLGYVPVALEIEFEWVGTTSITFGSRFPPQRRR